MGLDPMHTHEDGEADHDHDHDELGGEYDPTTSSLWAQDNIMLTSVGIDIGSAGTQVVFSRVQLRRLSEDLTSRYYVVTRETLHQSPVTLTPYSSEERIDEDAIGAIVDEAYHVAGIHPDDIDTGAVILTGEALRRENAKPIADVLTEVAGEFVCATAGHHMESMLAAYGSGAAKIAHDRGIPILNIDIGGGTTKLAVVEKGGAVGRTAAIHLGGRLAVVDAHGRLTRLDPAGKRLAAMAGCDWSLGDQVSDADLDRVASWMADALVAALTKDPSPPDVAGLWLTEPLRTPVGQALLGLPREPDKARPTEKRAAMFSGGVGEYVYGREARDFGDLGRRFGHAVRDRLDRGQLPLELLPAGECIRATALGASEYSVQLSGNTIYLSSPGQLLPRKNLQVIKPRLKLVEQVDPSVVAAAITNHFTNFDLIEGESEVALAFRWLGAPSYARLAGFARGLVEALPRTIKEEKPLYLVFDADIAQTIGALLKEELGVRSEILALDGILLWDFDYIDLGRVRVPSFTVPVTIKSLVFTADPRIPHKHHGHPHQ
jgi:ethanolamine utilization protein EutA